MTAKRGRSGGNPEAAEKVVQTRDKRTRGVQYSPVSRVRQAACQCTPVVVVMNRRERRMAARAGSRARVSVAHAPHCPMALEMTAHAYVRRLPHTMPHGAGGWRR